MLFGFPSCWGFVWQGAKAEGGKMSKIPVWMDCDTGTDDAVAIMLATYLDELEVLGISTAAFTLPNPVPAHSRYSVTL